MKPRIFINIHYMELGGAERALLGLLNAIDTNLVDVDLFVNQHMGAFMNLIPFKVNLLPERRGYNAIERPMKDIALEGQWGILWGRLKARRQHQAYEKTLSGDALKNDSSIFQFVANAVEPHLKPLDDLGTYDLAISFLNPHNIVLNKVKARRKIAWIHTDYSTIHVNSEQELPVWDGFDKIISISAECTRSFLTQFPSLESKIIEMENIMSPQQVREQAQNGAAPELEGFDGVKLVSVGRICQAKNYDNAPHVARLLKEKGLKFHWWIVGPGNQEPIKRIMAETGTEDCITFLGARDNPYPYIAAADIYMQPSRYEGKSVTVREAQMLYRPLIITNYPTSASQVLDGKDGVICGMDNQSIADAIYQLANDKEKQRQLSVYLATHDYGNESEVDKIYQLL